MAAGMNPDDLSRWLASSYPFLASTANQARFVELVREEVDGGKKEAMARLVAVNRLARENHEHFRRP